MRAAEQDRADVAEHRRMWRVWQRFMDPERFVFIDESGAATNTVRRYGWAPRSERLVTVATHGHWRTTTFMAGLRSTGLVAGDVVVMDNLAAHKAAGVEAAIRATRASILYLPPPQPFHALRGRNLGLLRPTRRT